MKTNEWNVTDNLKSDERTGWAWTIFRQWWAWTIFRQCVLRTTNYRVIRDDYIWHIIWQSLNRFLNLGWLLGWSHECGYWINQFTVWSNDFLVVKQRQNQSPASKDVCASRLKYQLWPQIGGLLLNEDRKCECDVMWWHPHAHWPSLPRWWSASWFTRKCRVIYSFLWLWISHNLITGTTYQQKHNHIQRSVWQRMTLYSSGFIVDERSRWRKDPCVQLQIRKSDTYRCQNTFTHFEKYKCNFIS